MRKKKPDWNKRNVYVAILGIIVVIGIWMLSSPQSIQRASSDRGSIAFNGDNNGNITQNFHESKNKETKPNIIFTIQESEKNPFHATLEFKNTGDAIAYNPSISSMFIVYGTDIIGETSELNQRLRKLDDIKAGGTQKAFLYDYIDYKNTDSSCYANSNDILEMIESGNVMLMFDNKSGSVNGSRLEIPNGGLLDNTMVCFKFAYHLSNASEHSPISELYGMTYDCNVHKWIERKGNCEKVFEYINKKITEYKNQDEQNRKDRLLECEQIREVTNNDPSLIATIEKNISQCKCRTEHHPSEWDNFEDCN